MEASSWGYFEIVKLLLDKGAEVNHQNKVSFNSIVVIIFSRFRLHVPDGMRFTVDQWVVIVHVYMYVPLHVDLRAHLHGVRVVGKVAVGLCGTLGMVSGTLQLLQKLPQWLFNRRLWFFTAGHQLHSYSLNLHTL